MLTYRVALAAACAALLVSAAHAQQPPPQFAACVNPTPPQLPPQWTGAYFMMPFDNTQPMAAEFISDSSAGATLSLLAGTQGGQNFFLVAGTQTYVPVYDQNGQLLSCSNLGDTGLRPMPQQWLPSGAQCVGSAPIVQGNVDWWHMPADPAPSANWIWYTTSDQTPYRLMWDNPSYALGLLSQFAFSYQTAFFTSVPYSLGPVVQFCQSNVTAHPAGSGATALRSILGAMARAPKAEATLKRLMPALDSTCSNTPLPQWQPQMRLTAMMTPVNINYTPLPTEVLYKWADQSQRTRMYWPQNSQWAYEDAMLISTQGYDIYQPRGGGAPVCQANLPGPPRPNWPMLAAPPQPACSCQGVINGVTPLTPLGSAMIMQCPMILPRVFWTWYTLQGQPMVFMETKSPADEGTGLALADYYSFDPNYQVPDGTFTLPSTCPAPGQAGTAPAAAAARTSGPRLTGHRMGPQTAATSGGLPPQCFGCHLGSAGGR